MPPPFLKFFFHVWIHSSWFFSDVSFGLTGLVVKPDPLFRKFKIKYMLPLLTTQKISNCCGVVGNVSTDIFSSKPDKEPTFQDLEICPHCGNHTTYVLETDRFRETDDLPEGLFTSND